VTIDLTSVLGHGATVTITFLGAAPPPAR
jgi:hypothetical protein